MGFVTAMMAVNSESNEARRLMREDHGTPIQISDQLTVVACLPVGASKLRTARRNNGTMPDRGRVFNPVNHASEIGRWAPAGLSLSSKSWADATRDWNCQQRRSRCLLWIVPSVLSSRTGDALR